MKLNLLLDNGADLRSGFINVDPIAPENDEQGRLKSDVSNLDDVCCDNEADEIVALDILDYYPGGAADKILSNWLRKLKHGGKLTFSVVDYREVARAVLANSISPDDVNELLYGKQEKKWQFKKGAFTLQQLVEVLSNMDYKVLSKRVQNYRAVITVERP